MQQSLIELLKVILKEQVRRQILYKKFMKETGLGHKNVVETSAKITFIHWLIDNESSAGGNGKWTHSNVKFKDIRNKGLKTFIHFVENEVRNWQLRKIMKSMGENND